jgi:hypothetical protein
MHHDDDEFEQYPHDRYPMSHSDDREGDSFDDEPMANEEETHKPSSKVALPDTQSVDLAKVKFPRRGDLALPDPALSALQLNNRDEVVSRIGARAGMPLPEDEMDAHLTTREDDAQARSYLPGPQGRVSRIMRRNSDGLSLPEAPSMDLASVGATRRDGLGLGDTGKNAVQEVL